MKKRIVIPVIFAALAAGTGFVLLSCPNINDKIKVSVTEMSVDPLTEKDIDYRGTRGYEIPDDIISKMREHMDDYKIISMYYNFENMSDKTTMNDVRFYPEFDEALSEKIITFNSGNGTYYIYVKPGFGGGMEHNIIINDPEKTAEQIYDELMGQTVAMVYYTGSSFHNTGQGYTGPGKQTLRFRLTPEEYEQSRQKYTVGSRKLLPTFCFKYLPLSRACGRGMRQRA